MYFVGYDTAPLSNLFPTFPKNVVSLSSRIRSSKESFFVSQKNEILVFHAIHLGFVHRLRLRIRNNESKSAGRIFSTVVQIINM